MITTILILLVAFQVKHFLCDFPFQTPYMLGKFKEKGWFAPLALHAWTHAVVTFFICGLVSRAPTKYVLVLMAFDFVVHFVMDRIKASPSMLGRYKALTAKEYPDATVAQKNGNTLFWWSLGLDQMVHHLTHYVIIYQTIRLMGLT